MAIESSDSIARNIDSAMYSTATPAGVNMVSFVLPPIGTADGGNDTTICALQYQLQGTSSSGTWNWSDPSALATFSPSSNAPDATVFVPTEGDYTLFWTFTDGAGCDLSGQIDIEFRLQPVAQSTDSLFFCQLLGNMLEAVPATGLSSGSWDIPVGSFSYNSILANSPVQNNSGFGNYDAIWMVTNTEFCTDSDTTHLIYSAPEQAEIEGFDIQVCGDSESITALNSNGTWSSPNPQISFANPTDPTTLVTTTAEGAYTLVWTVGTGDCATSDERTILFETPAQATITTANTEVCSNGSLSLTVVTTNGIGILWTSSGDGSFSNATNLATSYSPGATDSINGIVTITITTGGEGTCPDATDAVDIDIIPAVGISVPTFGNGICSTASISINATATNTSNVIWSTAGDGGFSPSSTVPVVAYSPGLTDATNGFVVLTLTGFPLTLSCNVVSATTTIPLIAPPNAGSDGSITLCETAAVIDLLNELAPGADITGTFVDMNDSGALSGTEFDPTIAVVGSYNFSYTVTGTPPCTDDSSTLTIEVIAGPNPGSDVSTSVCVAEPATNLTTLLSPDAELGGAWAPHPDLIGSVFDQTSAGPGNYVFFYILPATSVCEADSAMIQLAVTSGPSAGEDASVTECATSTSLELNTMLGGDPDIGGTWIDLSGTGALTDGVLDASLSGEGVFAFQYIVELAGCPSDTSTLLLEILPAPTIEMVIASNSICSADTIFLDAQPSDVLSIEWSTSGSGTFQNTGAITSYYVPSQSDIDAGTVDISIAATGAPTCTATSDSETFAIALNPTSNAGPDEITCGSDYIFQAIPSVGDGIWSGTPGIEDSSDPNTAISVPSPGVYTFTWTETNMGCSDSDEVMINFVSSPEITSFSVECVNTNIEYVVIIQLDQGDPLTYEFSVGGTSIGNEFTTDPFPTGSPYSIAVWDAHQCDTFLLEGNNTCPVLTDPGTFDTTPLNYCIGDEINALYNDDAFLDANDAFVFILHDESQGIGTVLASSSTPQFSFLATMLLGVTYYVSAVAGDDAGGGTIDLDDPNIVVSASVPITFHDSPMLTLNSSEIGFCLGDSALVEFVFTGTPPYTLEYMNGGSTTEAFFDSETGFFYVVESGLVAFISLSDEYCSADLEDELTVASYDLPTVTMPDSVWACSDSIINIDVILEGVGPWTYTVTYDGLFYSAHNTANSSIGFLPSNSGSYSIVDLMDSNCQTTQTDTTAVIITPSPTPDAGLDLIICSDQQALIGGIAEENTSYQWSSPDELSTPGSNSTEVILPPISFDVVLLNYILTADFEGCIARDSVLLTVNPLPQNYGVTGSLDVCIGDTSSIEAFGGVVYDWSANETLADPAAQSTLIFPIENTLYYVEITNEYACSVQDSIFIMVHELPIAQSSALVIDPCPPAQVLWVNETLGNVSECSWSFPTGTIINEDCSMADVSYSEAGLYTGVLSVTSNFGCTGTAFTDTIEIFSGIAEFSYSPNIISIDDSILHVFDISEDAVSQIWTFNGDTAGFGSTASLALEGLRPDYYELCLIMTTSQGCVDTTCKLIELDNPVAVFVPNTFTPDGDGLNDEFRAVINGVDYLKFFELSVYDRKGHVQFKSNNPHEAWDGINKRENTIAQGVFEWVLEIVVFGEPRPRRYLGTITVLK